MVNQTDLEIHLSKCNKLKAHVSCIYIYIVIMYVQFPTTTKNPAYKTQQLCYMKLTGTA